MAKAQTQALVLYHADGSTTDVELYTEPKITFSPDKVFIKSSVLDMEYAAADVLRFSFKGRATGIDGVKAEADYEQTDGHIVFHGAGCADSVAVFKPNGVRMPVRLKQQGRDAVLPLSSVPAGVYLVTVKGKTSKFVRK